MKVDAVETVEVDPKKTVHHTQPYVSLVVHLKDDNVRKAPEETRPMVPRAMTALPNEHHPREPVDVKR